MPDRSEAEQRELIEQAAQQRYGLTIDEWTESDGEVVGKIGRWYVSQEDADQGLYDGDEGTLTAQVVGSQQYHNETVMFAFTPDGQGEGSGSEVVPFEDIEPIV